MAVGTECIAICLYKTPETELEILGRNFGVGFLVVSNSNSIWEKVGVASGTDIHC